MNRQELWQRYKRHLCVGGGFGLRLDISRMQFEEGLFDSMAEPMERALAAMDAIEGGAIANMDEGRMVGHYWLRAPGLAPDAEVAAEIRQCRASIKAFAAGVHDGTIKPQRGDGFYVVLLIGIGGSALGPQFVCDALGEADDPMLIRFLDNTDPDGIDRVFNDLDEAIEETLTVVISKSGGTKETRNAMLEAAHRYDEAGLDFAKHAVAVTCDGSQLHQQAADESWLATFPMWDWVGGRTSVLSAVGLLPAALTGVDIDGLLEGANACDEVTRGHDVAANPAALLALMWHDALLHRARGNMVVMPYCDRLALFGRYLQQLVMESIGKELDRDTQDVNQGLTVYGNKGSTDQHAYVQQLREGTNDFFATLIGVQRDRRGPSIEVEPDVTAGDYLSGFLQGTRDALTENGRESMTITLDTLDAKSVGSLIALYERAVGLYAELINVNAYHQPGVEAGKKAAAVVIGLQRSILSHLRESDSDAQTAAEIAEAIGQPEAVETVFMVLEHVAANEDHGVVRVAGDGPLDARFGVG